MSCVCLPLKHPYKVRIPVLICLDGEFFLLGNALYDVFESLMRACDFTHSLSNERA